MVCMLFVCGNLTSPLTQTPLSVITLYTKLTPRRPSFPFLTERVPTWPRRSTCSLDEYKDYSRLDLTALGLDDKVKATDTGATGTSGRRGASKVASGGATGGATGASGRGTSSRKAGVTGGGACGGSDLPLPPPPPSPPTLRRPYRRPPPPLPAPRPLSPRRPHARSAASLRGGAGGSVKSRTLR